MKIKNVLSLEILDSRGNPTVRTILTLDDGSTHTSSVPSGASTGSHEAVELRDKDESRYQGKGVLQAVMHVNTVIKNAVVGREANPTEIDRILIDLDNTENKSKLGANAILSVSMATTRAAAYTENKPLWQYFSESYFTSSTPSFPRLMVNIINGGVHANWNYDIQEFMIVPNTTTPSKSIRIASEIYHNLGMLLKEKKLSPLVGDEGGYSPSLETNTEPFELIIEAALKSKYENIKDFRLSIDAAANEFFDNGRYTLKKENQELTADELMNLYKDLHAKYNLLSFEDAFSEDDWSSFIQFEKMAEKFQFITIGDDLFTSNPVRIARGIKEKAANGVLIKLNQIGTVSQTAEAINIAKKANWAVAVSHRSGETEDTFIADLAYSCSADFLKSGSMSRSERLAKYNRLLEIETEISK
ncbi:MAG: phosphopyruvate hydratase [Candidatus Levybacteria bacterium]|nr:phosphopyruvate hydratase [Candidatus Levybacteria bacterium]MBP9815205.1 phosphopyruvate hydratase [Candidatus Levybacteria bacterium]